MTPRATRSSSKPAELMVLWTAIVLSCAACSRPSTPTEAMVWPELAAGEQAVLFTGDVFLGDIGPQRSSSGMFLGDVLLMCLGTQPRAMH